jgi:hypothetical protein
VANSSQNSSDLDYADTLWKAADVLRGQVDAAEFKQSSSALRDFLLPRLLNGRVRAGCSISC